MYIMHLIIQKHKCTCIISLAISTLTTDTAKVSHKNTNPIFIKRLTFFWFREHTIITCNKFYPCIHKWDGIKSRLRYSIDPKILAWHAICIDSSGTLLFLMITLSQEINTYKLTIMLINALGLWEVFQLKE